MSTMEFSFNNLEQVVKFGELLGKLAQEGDVICLDGDLGAGKTTLTQAIGKGLQVPAEIYISSPSFNLLHEYPGRLPLFHMDLYRLTGPDDMIDAGLEEYLYMKGVAVIEWAERAREVCPDTSLLITMRGAGEEKRHFLCSSQGQQWLSRLEKIRQHLGS